MKYVFASPEWFACLHGIISERAASVAVTHPGQTYSICEVFTGVPSGLAADGGTQIAWHAVIRGVDVEFGTTEIEDAAFKAWADYAAILPLAQFDTRGEPARAAELNAMVEALVAQGKLRSSGSSPGSTLFAVHDAIARLTTAR